VADVTQRASVVWEGTIARGAGRLDSASGALEALPLDLPTRLGEASGKTTPEELLASAHAACFAISLGSVLARAGTPPERLEIHAAVTLDATEGNRRISQISLEADATVPDADEQSFNVALADAERRCLISRSLRGNVEITASGTLR